MYIITAYSASVIGYADISYSAVFYFNRDRRRARIYCVLHKLFYNGRGSFDNFARGNKLRYFFWQDFYLRHGFLLLYFFCTLCQLIQHAHCLYRRQRVDIEHFEFFDYLI